MRNTAIAFITALLFISCQNGKESQQNVNMMKLAMPDKATEEAAAATVDAAEESPAEPTDRKLIKNGNITFESEDIVASTNFIKRFVSTHKGYISNEREDKQDGSISKHLQIRLPNVAFNTFVSQLNKHAGTFTSKEISVDDVTEEYVDIAARLKTKKEVEKQFVNLLSKGKTVAEILNVEKELGEIRGDIESIEGRLKLMDSQISFSTLNLDYSTKTQSNFGFINKLGKAIVGGWELLSNFILGLVHIWPFFLIVIAIVIFLRKKLRIKKT